jgi:hypothetical protein
MAMGYILLLDTRNVNTNEKIRYHSKKIYGCKLQDPRHKGLNLFRNKTKVHNQDKHYFKFYFEIFKMILPLIVIYKRGHGGTYPPIFLKNNFYQNCKNPTNTTKKLQ